MTKKLSDQLRAIQHYDTKNMYDNIELAHKAAGALDAKDEALYHCDQQAEAYQWQIEGLDAEIDRLRKLCSKSDSLLAEWQTMGDSLKARNKLLEEVVDAADRYINSFVDDGSFQALEDALAKLDNNLPTEKEAT